MMMMQNSLSRTASAQDRLGHNTMLSEACTTSLRCTAIVVCVRGFDTVCRVVGVNDAATALADVMSVVRRTMASHNVVCYRLAADMVLLLMRVPSSHYHSKLRACCVDTLRLTADIVSAVERHNYENEAARVRTASGSHRTPRWRIGCAAMLGEISLAALCTGHAQSRRFVHLRLANACVLAC
jgi:hypothetical protein